MGAKIQISLLFLTPISPSFIKSLGLYEITGIPNNLIFNNFISRRIGVVATNITTLAPSPIFQLSDKYGLCKAKEQREPRVKGIVNYGSSIAPPPTVCSNGFYADI